MSAIITHERSRRLGDEKSRLTSRVRGATVHKPLNAGLSMLPAAASRLRVAELSHAATAHSARSPVRGRVSISDRGSGLEGERAKGRSWILRRADLRGWHVVHSATILSFVRVRATRLSDYHASGSQAVHLHRSSARSISPLLRGETSHLTERNSGQWLP